MCKHDWEDVWRMCWIRNKSTCWVCVQAILENCFVENFYVQLAGNKMRQVPFIETACLMKYLLLQQPGVGERVKNCETKVIRSESVNFRINPNFIENRLGDSTYKISVN